MKVKESGVPGPGFYAPSHKNDQTFSVGKAERFVRPLSCGPGPGSYAVREKPKTGNVVFGSAKRGKKESGGGTPGPGRYEAKNVDFTGAYSVRTRFRDPNGEGGPGPGSYSPAISYKNERRTVFGTGRRPSLHQKPAQSPPARKFDLPFQTPVSFRFSTARRY